MNRFTLLLILLSQMSIAMDIPSGVYVVESAYIKHSMVRVIGYYNEQGFNIDIQKINYQAPDLSQTRTINHVTVNNAVYDFYMSSGVEYNVITINGYYVKFEVEFHPLQAPNVWLLSCQVDVGDDPIPLPDCTRRQLAL